MFMPDRVPIVLTLKCTLNYSSIMCARIDNISPHIHTHTHTYKVPRNAATCNRKWVIVSKKAFMTTRERPRTNLIAVDKP